MHYYLENITKQPEKKKWPLSPSLYFCLYVITQLLKELLYKSYKAAPVALMYFSNNLTR